ncbi:MAG: NADH:flavin oxidoreductase [Actinobacteria bacterium]|nr:NADH:flavin oxidoreductase [Actinomycetota bacterium]
MDTSAEPSVDPSSPPSPSPFEPGRLGPLRLRNRIIKAATFEGVMRRGAVSDELIDFHVRVARGGAALTTVAYCAISKGGRVSPDTMVLRDELVPDLRRLTDGVHAEGALVAAQLGHAGLVAQGHNRRNPSIAPSRRFSPAATGVLRAATEADIDDLVGQFAAAARVAADSGFDAVELHLGHNYLLSSFLSPNLNKRRDEYGGSIENRLRFPRRVIEAIREVLPDEMALWAKFNMADGVAKGLWLDESLPMAKVLEADGQLDALELTGGSSLLNGMYFFRGDVPMKEFVAAQPKVIGWGVKLYGPKLFPKYPFEEAFFLDFARQFRAELSMPLIYLGGANERATLEQVLGEGFSFVAMARALLRDPDLPNKMAANDTDHGLCVHCNKCMATIYSGTHCVLVPEDER